MQKLAVEPIAPPRYVEPVPMCIDCGERPSGVPYTHSRRCHPCFRAHVARNYRRRLGDPLPKIGRPAGLPPRMREIQCADCRKFVVVKALNSRRCPDCQAARSARRLVWICALRWRKVSKTDPRWDIWP
jgi:hypothetical protein